MTPPLRPEAYRREDTLAAERAAVLASAWYPVATGRQLARAGDFVTARCNGVPIVVRNFGDRNPGDGNSGDRGDRGPQVVAVRNVCAHRACTIVSEAAGTAEKLRCPYHGWEYGADGRTRKLPGAKNFPGFDREAHRLDRFPVDRLGDVWMVRPSEEGPSLREFIGEPFEHFAAHLSPPTWAPTMVETVSYAANWKIPIEGSLESYHIPAVHPKTFGNDPGEDRSDHTLAAGYTNFLTSFKVDSWLTRLEDWALRRLGTEPAGIYEHWHVFPNLMFSLTDSVSLIQSLEADTPRTCTASLFQYTRQPAGRGVVARATASSLGRIAAGASLKILDEDRPMFEAVQRGLDGLPEDHPRRTIFGRCEERLYAFQEWTAAKLAANS